MEAPPRPCGSHSGSCLSNANCSFLSWRRRFAAIFAIVTKKWLPVGAGALVALPSIVGLLGERSSLLQIPLRSRWQANQSVAPLALLSLGGYFAGYSDRLGLAAEIAVFAMLALAIAGTVVARRRRAVLWTALGAIVVYRGIGRARTARGAVRVDGSQRARERGLSRALRPRRDLCRGDCLARRSLRLTRRVIWLLPPWRPESPWR